MTVAPAPGWPLTRKVGTLLGLFLLAAIGLLKTLPQAQKPASQESLTAYARFDRLCLAMVVGYNAPDQAGNAHPKIGRHEGTCPADAKPLLLSVTHENDRNTHSGSANFDPKIKAYMGDFNPSSDLGRWLSYRHDPASGLVGLGLDTLTHERNDVTGWPLKFGHLFVGFNDLSAQGPLDQTVVVEFDIRIPHAEVRPDLWRGFSGRRIMFGALLRWQEDQQRNNDAHFIEFDLVNSRGYNESFGDPSQPHCKDEHYDRCFYDPSGRYAEGRNLDYARSGRPAPTPGADGWTRIVIPLSNEIKRLSWASPPSDWSKARISGAYFAIESQGATRTWIELKNYQLRATSN